MAVACTKGLLLVLTQPQSLTLIITALPLFAHFAQNHHPVFPDIMAEVLGLVASGISIGTLVVQISEAVHKLHSFYASVQDAPKDIQDTLDELEVFSQILLDLKDDFEEKRKNKARGGTMVDRCIRFCEKAAEELTTILTQLDHGLLVGGARRHWASIQRVLKRDKINEMHSRLERAKSMLNLAVSLLVYKQLISGSNYEVNKSAPETEAAKQEVMDELPPSQDSHTVASKRSLNRRSWWLGLGWYSYQMTSVLVNSSNKDSRQGSGPDSDEIIVNQRFIPKFRLFGNGLWIQSVQAKGNWQYTFRPLRIIPEDSLIFDACKYGDLEKVMLAFKDGLATVYDSTPSGWTLLHVAAKYAQPSICKWLLQQGAQCTATDVRRQRTPLHFAARYAWDMSLPAMNPTTLIDNDSVHQSSDRQARIYETIRLLIENGHSDPMAVDSKGRSVLHCYNGATEPFLYMISQQQHFQIDLNQRARDNFTVTQYHAVHREASAPNILRTIFGLGTGSHSLATTRNSYGSTWLMVTVVRLVILYARGESLEPSLELIGDLIDAGSDVNTCNNEGTTPLDRILSFRLKPEDRQPLIQQWLNLLLTKKVDLHQYAKKEDLLHENGQVKDVWNYRRGIKRYFTFQYGGETSELSITVKDIQAAISEEDTRVPGAWDTEGEYAQRLGLKLIEEEEPSANWSVSTSGFPNKPE